MADDGDPRLHQRPGALHGAAALDLDEVAAGLLDEALGRGERLRIGRLIRPERQIRDEQGLREPAPDRLREHDHLVDRDGHRAVVAEHRHRGGVADEHHVDARGLGDLRTGMVVGGDHDDRFAGRLLRGEVAEREATGGGGVRAHARASVSRVPTASSTWMIVLVRSTCTTVGT